MFNPAPKYTRAVRESILERDEYKCQGCSIFSGCRRKHPVSIHPHRKRRGKRGGDLHVHHLLPQKFSSVLGLNPNYPTNLITICAQLHVSEDGIHPDVAVAHQKYQNGNQNAFNEMVASREELLQSRRIYWNDQYDRQLSVIAARRTQNALQRGWTWLWSSILERDEDE